MSLSIFDELSVEFRNVYNVLSDFESIEYLEQFKSEKPTQIKDLRAYNVLKNNLVRLSFEHNRSILEQELQELKQQYNNDLKSKIAPKQELLNELVKKSYEKFEEFNNINLQPSENNQFDFAKVKIKNTHKSNIDPFSSEKTKTSFGDFTRQCFLNLQGKTREHLSKSFEDLFSNKIVEKLAEKMSGRLFNLYAKAQKGQLRDQKGSKEFQTHREIKLGKVQLNSYDYKEAYSELRDLKKVLKNYVPNSKIDEVLKDIKNRSKQIFKNATFEKDKMREIERENEALKREIEALKKAQAPKEPKDDNKGTPQAKESKKEIVVEDIKEELKDVYELVRENELVEAEVIENIEEIEEQQPQQQRFFKLNEELTLLSQKYNNIPKNYFLRVQNDSEYIKFAEEQEKKAQERERVSNERTRRNELVIELIKQSKPQEAQEKKDDSQAKEERAKKLLELKAQAKQMREQEQEKKAQEKEASEKKSKEDEDNNRNRKR